MGRVLSVKEIRRIADQHGEEPFCARDKALISLAGMAYFSATELSLLRVSDLITERHELVYDGYLPAEMSTSSHERYFFIGKKTYLQATLSEYIGWRIDHGFGMLDRDLYCGLNPDSRVFLKDDGTEFSLNFKSQSSDRTLTQALQMQRHFKGFYLGEGVSLNVLQDSFIANFWQIKSQEGTTQAIRDLIDMTGLTAETLRKKCIRQQRSIKDILGNLYR